MRLAQPQDLAAQMVQCLYSAENQLILALPRVAARASLPDLRTALEQHWKQTRTHSSRLEEVAEALRVPCAGRRSHAMEGLLKEGEESLGYGGDEALVDAAIIASCRSIEAYEIAQYEALRDLLTGAAMPEIASVAKITLAEEEDASQSLAYLMEAMSKELTAGRT